MKVNKGGDQLGWLTSENCKEGDLIILQDSGRTVESTKFKYEDGNPVKQLVFKVSHKGEDKSFNMNKPSKENFIDSHGEETEKWIGAEAKICITYSPKTGKKTFIVLEPTNVSQEVKEDRALTDVQEENDR